MRIGSKKLRDAIKEFCRECNGIEGRGSMEPIYNCTAGPESSRPCPLYPVRPSRPRKELQNMAQN